MRSLLFAFTFAAACGSADDVKFGRISDIAKQTIHDWCKGDLEMESHMEVGKLHVLEGPNLLIMHCLNSGSGESGWLAFDSATDDLVDVFLSIHPSDFDYILSRVVVPSLDAEQKAAYDDLHAVLAKASSTTTKHWNKGKAYMDVTAIQITAPNSEPIWEFMLGYKEKERE